MQAEVIIAGFGGQGVLFAGQILAFAGMDQGRKLPGCPPTVQRCAAVRRTAP